MLKTLALAAAAGCASATKHHDGHDGRYMGRLNPLLGTHGYEDCTQPGPISDDVSIAQMTMVCHQVKGSVTALKVGCIGDSITAGAHSSGPTKTYPAQMQAMLDAASPGQYAVTNLGACGSTMQKGADSPYWQRPQYTTLIKNTWDIIVIMLGTNDAKDPGDGGPNNWHDNCGPSINNLTLAGCTFAEDYLAMIDVVRGLGTTPGVPPTIFIAAPPPLMQHGSIGANQTVINTVYSALIPQIGHWANVSTVPVSIYTAMGGVENWEATFPPSCTASDYPWPACPWFCDAQSCDQCHPNDNGYTRLATMMRAGMGL